SHAVGRIRAEDLIAWAREHMAAYKVPREVAFVDSLPKSGSGKVLWRVLQAQEDGAGRGAGCAAQRGAPGARTWSNIVTHVMATATPYHAHRIPHFARR